MDLIQKTRDDYNTIAKHFAVTRYQASELEQFKPYIKDGQYILDWGCGNGRLLLVLGDKKVHYVGTDQSQGLLKIARKEYQNLVKKGVARFFSTAHKDKKFPDDYFDLVFMVASFHHLPDKKSRLKLLKKIFQEMKTDARLIITVWNLESEWAKEKLKKDWKKIGEQDVFIPWKDQTGKIVVDRYYHHFTEQELRDLLEQTGFAVEKMYYAGAVQQTAQKGGRNLVAIAKK